MITDEMIAKAAFEVNQEIMNKLPEPSECTHTFSPPFERKMRKLIRRTNHFIMYKVLRYAACFVIALLLSAGMVFTFNTDARAAALDWIKERLEGWNLYSFVGEEHKNEPQNYSLGWVPEGYSLLNSFEANDSTTHVYISSSGQMMQFKYLRGASNQSYLVGSGEYECKNINIGTLEAELYLAKNAGESNIFTWDLKDCDVMFVITAFLEEEDFIKIAQSVASE